MELSKILTELGEDREQYFRAVAPPIMQTSNFAFKRVEDLRKAFQDEMQGYLYSRGVNPTVDILREKLAALDGAEDALVFNNGAAAIFAGVLANVKSGDHIVSVRNPYTWVQRMFDVILPRFGITVTYVEGTELSHWEEALQPQTSFFYLESPNSWTFQLQDLEGVAQLARKYNIVTLIDNSYCTPLYQQPIALGIDMAMQTATKYIGGHSDTLGGVLTGSHAMMKKIFDSEYLNIGSGIQPFNAWLLLRGLRTLKVRLDRISATTLQMVQFLKQHPKVEKVLFPLDDTFPQIQLARKQMKGACGLLTVVIKTKRMEDVVKFCETLHHFLMAVSWGGYESLVIPKCASLAPADFSAANPEHRMVRIYVGLEDAEYLIADLRQALDSF
ncbi:MAG: trans-sulfuration enzyme family protein [Chitinophagaceae bacterium]